jgi:high-affinity iron transporter
MLASLLVVFREVFEAGLIVGLVLAATENVARRGFYIAAGIVGGVAGAAALALFAGALSRALSGIGPEVFNAAVLALAVLMLGWHSLWMAKHGREAARAATALGRAVAAGERSLPALGVVVAVAVLREGSEVVLFLYGIAATGHDSVLTMTLGGLAGVAGGVMVSFLLYRGLVAIPTRHLFSVTNVMIALLAAGMAGQAAAFLASVDLIPSWGDRLWDTSAILSADGMVGRALHALMGYSDQPSGVQVAAYLATLSILLAGSRIVGGSPRRPAALPARAEHA